MLIADFPHTLILILQLHNVFPGGPLWHLCMLLVILTPIIIKVSGLNFKFCIDDYSQILLNFITTFSFLYYGEVSCISMFVGEKINNSKSFSRCSWADTLPSGSCFSVFVSASIKVILPLHFTIQYQYSYNFIRSTSLNLCSNYENISKISCFKWKMCCVFFTLL